MCDDFEPDIIVNMSIKITIPFCDDMGTAQMWSINKLRSLVLG